MRKRRHSGFPSVEEFEYSFDALADLTEALLVALGIDRYALYVQDYGAPIGWRLALRRPDAITAIVTQHGNGYEEGFVESFWEPPAFRRGLPDAQIHLLPGGHFQLESAVDGVADLIRDFLSDVTVAAPAAAAAP